MYALEVIVVKNAYAEGREAGHSQGTDLELNITVAHARSVKTTPEQEAFWQGYDRARKETIPAKGDSI